ncbi:hypothetical protein BBO_09269 [Beauveria brongniartii RCEF 3172]|uniref:Uncharacterized protein n=1 Tax=Beauveria brongniartii RCEF 3172 TaxID=1081107 RepID=A0A166W1U7_9HYPO|nr:hypothetical protein BBO_09269 [Beauveria brongniartii RCEF 3172]
MPPRCPKEKLKIFKKQLKEARAREESERREKEEAKAREENERRGKEEAKAEEENERRKNQRTTLVGI